jgi:hypothetical protein
MSVREAVVLALAGLLYGAGWAVAEKIVDHFTDKEEDAPADARECPLCDGAGSVRPA